MQPRLVRLLSALAALLAATLAAAPVAAQRALDVERFRPAHGKHGFVGIQGTRVPEPGRWNASLWMSYSEELLTLQAPTTGSSTEAVERRLTGDLMAQVGIAGRLALALDVPLVLWQDGDTSVLRDDAGKLPHTALGDPRLSARVRVLGEGSDVDRDRAEGFGLAVMGTVTAPIGNDDAFAAEENVTTDVQVLADFHLLGAGVGLMAGWRSRFEAVQLGTKKFDEELLYGIALKVPVPVTHDFAAIVEVRGATNGLSPFGDHARTPVEGELAFQLQRGDFTLWSGVGTGFTSGVGTPEVRGLMGLSWAPREHDADGDGIPDDVDDCAHLAEDLDGFEDDDGCPDPDNDNDLVPDADDACPNEPAEPGRDQDMDGCTDPVRDRDGDGLDDAQDACPGEPEDEDGFEDEDGCPDPDNDGDGVPDADDECPDEPEDADGFEDADGCPDPDNDGDGVPDADDECPDEPEDADGFEDADGCPDPDNDRDSVADADDECPDEREDIDGRDDDDGCPEDGGRALWRGPLAEPPPDLWRGEGEGGAPDRTLSGSVRFDDDGQLTPIAERVVDQLARHLTALWGERWAITIAEADVETDEDEPEDVRPKTLREALTERGVPAERFEIRTDSELRGNRVRVTRIAEAAEETEAPEEAADVETPEKTEDTGPSDDDGNEQ